MRFPPIPCARAKTQDMYRSPISVLVAPRLGTATDDQVRESCRPNQQGGQSDVESPGLEQLPGKASASRMRLIYRKVMIQEQGGSFNRERYSSGDKNRTRPSRRFDPQPPQGGLPKVAKSLLKSFSINYIWRISKSFSRIPQKATKRTSSMLSRSSKCRFEVGAD